MKSPLFIAFTLPYAQSAITLPTTFYVLTTFTQNQPIAAAMYVGIIDTIARSAMFLVLYVITRKMVKLNIPWKNIAKYVFAPVVMASILFLIPHPTRLLFTLGITAAGAILYLTLRGVHYSISFIFWWTTLVMDNFLLTVKSQQNTKK